ncbi:beta-lactamase-like protein [Hypomontagnella monticulosa]|nr:beta-lactamase-like protein [Hypomontagnella monticulosa]
MTLNQRPLLLIRKSRATILDSVITSKFSILYKSFTSTSRFSQSYRKFIPGTFGSYSTLAGPRNNYNTLYSKPRCALPTRVGVKSRFHQQSRHLTMSSKLIPSNPADVAVIRNITPNVVTVSVPFSRFGVIRIGGRGTIIRLTSGTLAVFSPVALTPETQAKVTELGGNVGYLIAGDLEHHIFLTEWAKAYPNAKLVGPKGLAEKRAKVQNDPKIGHEAFAFEWDAANKHSNAVSDEFAADFEVEFVDAHPNKEVVLFFKPEKILIEADLLFNLPATEQYSKVPEAEKKGNAWLNRLFESLNSTAGEAKGLKRFLWYVLSNGNKDRAGFNESVKRIDAWDFETLIPCHGETIVGNGKELFRKAFEWHIQGHK